MLILIGNIFNRLRCARRIKRLAIAGSFAAMKNRFPYCTISALIARCASQCVVWYWKMSRLVLTRQRQKQFNWYSLRRCFNATLWEIERLPHYRRRQMLCNEAIYITPSWWLSMPGGGFRLGLNAKRFRLRSKCCPALFGLIALRIPKHFSFCDASTTFINISSLNDCRWSSKKNLKRIFW